MPRSIRFTITVITTITIDMIMTASIVSSIPPISRASNRALIVVSSDMIPHAQQAKLPIITGVALEHLISCSSKLQRMVV